MVDGPHNVIFCRCLKMNCLCALIPLAFATASSFLGILNCSMICGLLHSNPSNIKMRAVIAGPGSSTSNWKPTYDSGKHAPASKTSTDGFRVSGDISGPTSSHKAYTATEDSGKYVGATTSFSDGFRVSGDISGPTSSHKAYTATEDSGKYAGTTETFSDGYRATNVPGENNE